MNQQGKTQSAEFDALEALRFIAFRTDGEGRWVHISARWSELTGHPVEETLGEFFLEAIHPEDWVNSQPLWAELMRGERETIVRNLRLIGASHKAIPVEISARRVSDAEGEVHILGVLREQANQQGERDNASHVEAQVAQLAGGLAHDFNNMLQGISSATELLKRRFERSDPDYDCCEIIAASSERLSDLITQLVSFARVGPHYPMSTSTEELITSSINQSKVALREDITTEIEVSSKAATIFIDHAQLLRAMTHVLDNAADAMRAQGGSIKISASITQLERQHPLLAEDELSDGVYTLITIEDDGVGLDKAHLERAFEPFFSTTPTQRGMGLSVARGIVRQHEGVITIERRGARPGTRVSLYLPVREGQAPTISEDVTVEMRAWTGTRKTILVVDDEPAVLRTTSRTLTEYGFDVLAAASGERALELYARHQSAISLCVVDYIMPGLSGRDLLTAFRRIDPDVKLLICTGYDLRRVSHTPHHEHVIFKPCGAEQLVAMIHKLRD